MSLPFNTIFPTYNLGLRKPKKSKINIGSRRIYVDFPQWIYKILYQIVKKYSARGISADRLHAEFENGINKKKKDLPNNELFFNISLGKGLAYDNTITLSVKWPKFFSYLDKEAETYAKSIIDSGGKQIQKMHDSLNDNYEKISKFSVQENRWSNRRYKSYIKTLKLTGDYYKLLHLYILIAETFKNLALNNKFNNEFLVNIEKIQNDIYTASFSMQIGELNTVVVFLFLRRLIEDTLTILKLSPKYQKLKESTKKKLENIKTKNIHDFFKALKSAGIKLDNPNILGNLYSACNEVIHKTVPFYFNSVLEFKVIIKLINRYFDSLIELIEEFFDLYLSQIIGNIDLLTALSNSEEPGLSKREKNAFRILRSNYLVKAEIKKVLSRYKEIKKDNIFFDPKMLGAILYLFSPTSNNISSGIFNIQDVYSFIFNISRISSKDFTIEFEYTLSRFIKELDPTFKNKINEYSKLNLNDDEKRVVIFCIIADNYTDLI
jgi:hypothetical protein